ncbi:hypothetical protein TNCV_2561741 [Trichonephila clavipes]|uniref:Uncharacterized protein n=1 Tax=Trichonephila clavipes TaxID=2585209 RepID=A0A8X6RAY0_TRICX|nr:hypothetical protein TNCV_2561741 [Trichonephila clavipes]
MVYPCLWIGNEGPVLWPSLLPDLIPLDILAYGVFSKKWCIAGAGRLFQGLSEDVRSPVAEWYRTTLPSHKSSVQIPCWARSTQLSGSINEYQSITIDLMPTLCVLRRNDSAYGLGCVSLCCLYFLGHYAAETCVLIHSMERSSLSRTFSFINIGKCCC